MINKAGQRIAMLGVCVSIFFSATSYLEAKESVYSFSTAKKKLYRTVYQNSGETFYCGCGWSKKKKLDLKSCGLQSYFPKSQKVRSERKEAEHLYPASWLLRVNGKDRACVKIAKEKGQSPRKYCQKTDRNYKQAHNDLVNLVPANGAINQARSNKPFVEAVNRNSKGYNGYGRCDVEIDSRGIIPPADKRGDIARVGAYLSHKYGLKYSKRQQLLFDKWAAQDPVSKEERARNQRIIKVQGYGLEL